MKRVWTATYMLGILAEILIRAPHERRRRQTLMAVEQVDRLERSLIGLLFCGVFFVPAVYTWTAWLDWANYRLSAQRERQAGTLGTVLMVSAVWVFWRAHRDLGQNWSPSLQLRQEHALVTRGVYRYVRHPMYASQWLWSAAQALLLHNWIAGMASFVLFAPLYVLRVPREERMLLQQFGPAYQRYMERTGRVLPRMRNIRSD